MLFDFITVKDNFWNLSSVDGWRNNRQILYQLIQKINNENILMKILLKFPNTGNNFKVSDLYRPVGEGHNPGINIPIQDFTSADKRISMHHEEKMLFKNILIKIGKDNLILLFNKARNPRIKEISANLMKK